MMGSGMFGFGFGFIWMLLFWGGLIVLAIFLIRALFPAINPQTQNDKPASPSSAQDILKRRYARGEVTTEQYQEMLSTLQQE
jgi:putative membrane protein